VLKSLFSLLIALALSSARGAELKIDFGDFSTGGTPTNFHNALAGGGKPGEWKIVMDEVPSAFTPLTGQSQVVNRQGVLAQTSQDPTDERFPMLIYDGETFKDFQLTTQFKIVSGGAEQMAGVVFRYQDEKNFYVVRASALGHNLRFYSMVQGIRSDPIGPTMDISIGVWHSLIVQCQGDKIICWFDGHLAMPPLYDNTFAEGKIGFWTKSDAVSHFCNTSIIYTPRVPAAQILVQSIMQKYPRILGLRIYTPDDKGQPRVIASKDEKEIGQSGTDAEEAAITKGTVSFGRGRGTVVITLPFRDRNGDPMAAVRVRLNSFFGETQDTALTRAMIILKDMQAQILSSADLTQ
jgi:3-keto-disaccharide hydrolase